MMKVLIRWTKPISGGKDFNMYGKKGYGNKKSAPKKKKKIAKKKGKKK